jgi:hypothetical protein
MLVFLLENENELGMRYLIRRRQQKKQPVVTDDVETRASHSRWLRVISLASM